MRIMNECRKFIKLLTLPVSLSQLESTAVGDGVVDVSDESENLPSKDLTVPLCVRSLRLLDGLLVGM